MKRRMILIVALILIAAAIAAINLLGDADREAGSYESDVEAWRAKRIDRLRSPTGYLSLAGLYWLREGESPFGSDASNAVVFPSKHAPKHMGVFRLENGKVSVVIRDGVDVRSDGEPVTRMQLHHDNDPDHDRTELTWDTMTWYAIKRGDKYGIRLKDSNSETRRSFKGIESYPIDRRWSIEGHFERYDPIKRIPITSVGDIHTMESSTGAIVFEIDGTTHRLDVLAEPGDESLWVVFADETSGRETYGGGRYVYVDAPGEDGKVTIDFNRSYNPPCAFSAFTTCALPPPQNLLPIRVTAGEKTYKHEKDRS